MSKNFEGWRDYVPKQKPVIKKRNKYNNTKVEIDGVKFDSKKESARYAILRVMQDWGIIKELELQKVFHFTKNDILICKYKADFVYIEEGKLVVEDCKGFKTAIYRLKKKMMKAFYGIDIKES